MDARIPSRPADIAKRASEGMDRDHQKRRRDNLQKPLRSPPHREARGCEGRQKPTRTAVSPHSDRMVPRPQERREGRAARPKKGRPPARLAERAGGRRGAAVR